MHGQAHRHQIGLNGGLPLISAAAVLIFCSRQSFGERFDLLHFYTEKSDNMPLQLRPEIAKDKTRYRRSTVKEHLYRPTL